MYGQAWINLPSMSRGSTPGTLTVDLSPLEGQILTAVKYAWGGTNCCKCRMARTLVYTLSSAPHSPLHGATRVGEILLAARTRDNLI